MARSGKLEDDGVFKVAVEIPLILRFDVEAKDKDEAREIAIEALRGMRFKTWPKLGQETEHFGVEESNGRPARGVTFGYPESPSMCDDIEIEELA